MPTEDEIAKAAEAEAEAKGAKKAKGKPKAAPTPADLVRHQNTLNQQINADERKRALKILAKG